MLGQRVEIGQQRLQRSLVVRCADGEISKINGATQAKRKRKRTDGFVVELLQQRLGGRQVAITVQILLVVVRCEIRFVNERAHNTTITQRLNDVTRIDERVAPEEVDAERRLERVRRVPPQRRTDVAFRSSSHSAFGVVDVVSSIVDGCTMLFRLCDVK
jgi:hypothetical protein